MESPPPAVALTPTQAAALTRAEALTAELIELVATLRAPPPEDLGDETLPAGDLRRAFSAAVRASREGPRRRPRDLVG